MEVGCKYSDIAYPNTCYHNVLLLAAMIMTSASCTFFSTGEYCLSVLTVAIPIK